MRLLMEIILSILCLMAACLVDSRAVDNDSYEFEETKHHRHHRHRKFTIDELTNTRFPHAITGDLDIDVCKADVCFVENKIEGFYRKLGQSVSMRNEKAKTTKPL
uniref:Uncharacterized protein n=1 Tax=Vespula pensylvanica TaxID=30213 RepID=A0A834UET0_VESPE|nr:hypothetical protein H0235_002896 [Vespula pensylvanica]